MTDVIVLFTVEQDDASGHIPTTASGHVTNMSFDTGVGS